MDTSNLEWAKEIVNNNSDKDIELKVGDLWVVIKQPKLGSEIRKLLIILINKLYAKLNKE